MSSGVIGGSAGPPPDPAPAGPSAPPSPELRPARSYARIVLDNVYGGWAARLATGWIVFLLLVAVFAPFLANSRPLLLKSGGRWSSPLIAGLDAVDVVLLLGFFSVAVLAPMRRLPPRTRWAVGFWIAATAIVLVGWPTLPLAFADQVHDVAPELASLFTRWGASGPGPFSSLLLTKIVAAASTIGGVIWLLARVGPWGRAHSIALAWTVLVAVAFAWITVRPRELLDYSMFRQLQQAGRVEAAVYPPIRFSPTDKQRQTDQDIAAGRPPVEPFERPRREHWMGTESNAQDVASRIIHASRIALAIGIIATGIEVVLGVVLGGLMGYFAGWADIFGMRLVEIIEAIPTIFLLITFVAFFGRNIYAMMVIIGVTGWTANARFIRAEFLRLRKQDFVQAAIATGLPLRSILFRHMLPNGMAPVLVNASFGIAAAILYEATLSFIGLGLVDQPSWGQLLNEALTPGGLKPWIMIFPGLVIFLTVLSLNLVGEAVRDSIDPHLKKVAQI